MKKIAVITGASSGLGTELLKHAERLHPEIDAFYIIARREDKLKRIAEGYSSGKVIPLPLDLSDEGSFEEYKTVLEKSGGELALLINDAGCGTIGDLAGKDYKSQTNMVDLNVRALTAITTISLPFMKEGGVILNVCSIASFAPNPGMTVYCSTKAYVLSFTKSLRFELKKRKINVCAVCPGPMDTEFLPVAGINKGVSKTFDTLPRVNPSMAAEGAIKAAYKGRCVYTPKAFYKFYRFLCKLLPHNLIMPMSKT